MKDTEINNFHPAPRESTNVHSISILRKQGQCQKFDLEKLETSHAVVDCSSMTAPDARTRHKIDFRPAKVLSSSYVSVASVVSISINAFC
jgi:hypothetical protein